MSPVDFESHYFELGGDDDVVVARFVSRRLTDEDNVEQLGHELVALVDKLQRRRVVLDVENIDYVTSSVIGKWILLHRKLDREGGKMVFCGIRPSLQMILDTAKLLGYINVSTDSQAARNACLVAKPAATDAAC